MITASKRSQKTNTSNGAGQVTNGSSLSSGVGGQTLSNICGLERSPAEREDNSEDEDHGNCGVGSRGVVTVVERELAGSSDDGETARAEYDGVEQKRATTDNVGHTGTKNGTEEAKNWVDTIESQNLLLFHNAGVLHHDREIVRAANISHSHTQDTNKSTSCTVTVPESAVVPPRLVSSIRGDLVGHLLDLHDDHGMVGVTFTVVLSKDLDSILNTVLGDEPSRRLRQEENEDYHKAGCDHLTPDGNSPSDVILFA
ncbi:hypothetical protein HG531_008887 [Fusarium graminearum]|nr:hypothetical protein HG531_008887 [Fusarium graminearum]